MADNSVSTDRKDQEDKNWYWATNSQGPPSAAGFFQQEALPLKDPTIFQKWLQYFETACSDQTHVSVADISHPNHSKCERNMVTICKGIRGDVSSGALGRPVHHSNFSPTSRNWLLSSILMVMSLNCTCLGTALLGSSAARLDSSSVQSCLQLATPL